MISLDLISCNFGMIVAHFHGGGDVRAGKGEALAPPVYMLKRAMV